MKKILFLLLVPFYGFAQNDINDFWKNDFWQINKVVTHELDLFELSNPPAESVFKIPDGTKYIYGNSLTFNTNGTFISKYSADCGNDCFTRSEGTFEKIDETHLRLQINLFSRFGRCEGLEDRTVRDLGTFEIKPTEDGYQLIKLKDE
ncbi:hypothetical protein [uncultured Gilliamella sp.]|uniref:hypothetical protein n=1 Tax=uncultured Gilliamella sp. TaxID=1193505 RepID=UPI0025E036DE|nr:hypothetical protein [uncultured Gilliamella sp.]